MSEVVHLKPPSASGYCYCGHASCFQCSVQAGSLRRLLQIMNRPKPVPAKLKVIELLYGNSGGDLADWLEGYRQAIALLKRECRCFEEESGEVLIPCLKCVQTKMFLDYVDSDIERFDSHVRCEHCEAMAELLEDSKHMNAVDWCEKRAKLLAAFKTRRDLDIERSKPKEKK